MISQFLSYYMRWHQKHLVLFLRHLNLEPEQLTGKYALYARKKMDQNWLNHTSGQVRSMILYINKHTFF